MQKFFRKIGLFLTLGALLFGNIPAAVASELLFGQQHTYSVVFRGNEEAIVYVKIVVTNPNDRPLTEFSFDVPGVLPAELTIYQQKLSQECARYDYTASANRGCLEYRDPDYNRSYYGDLKSEYQKVTYRTAGSHYQMTLPTAVEPYKSTALIVSYAAVGYVESSAGRYDFTFETIKVASRVNQVSVSIDVDSDLLIKGKRANVNYGGYGNDTALSGSSAAGLSSRELDAVVGRIAATGPVFKYAKNLAPGETFTVKGKYATNWFNLYRNQLALTVLLIVALLALVYYFSGYMKKRADAKAGPTPSAAPRAQIVNFMTVSVGLLSAALVIGFTLLLRWLLESDLLRVTGDLFAIIGVISIVLLYLLVVFGPAIFMATKRGWRALLAVLTAELVWFLIYLGVYLAWF